MQIINALYLIRLIEQLSKLNAPSMLYRFNDLIILNVLALRCSICSTYLFSCKKYASYKLGHLTFIVMNFHAWEGRNHFNITITISILSISVIRSDDFFYFKFNYSMTLEITFYLSFLMTNLEVAAHICGVRWSIFG